MKRTVRVGVGLWASIPLVIFLGCGGGETATVAAGSEVPTFEVDADWPTIPDGWVLGQVASVAVDSRDHVWVLQRPGTLEPDEMSMAAPPVLEFDPEGNYVQGWGGPNPDYPGRGRSHRAPHDTNAAACGPRHALEYAADGRGDRFPSLHDWRAVLEGPWAAPPPRVQAVQVVDRPRTFVEKRPAMSSGCTCSRPSGRSSSRWMRRARYRQPGSHPARPPTLKRGRAGTFTHDVQAPSARRRCLRPLDVGPGLGHIIQECMPKHRHQEFLRFMNTVVRTTAKVSGHPRHPRQLRLTHKHGGKRVKQWLHASIGESISHFTPTSASWLNARRTVLQRTH